MNAVKSPKTLRALLAQWRPAGERVPLGGEAGALAAAWPEAVGEDVARRTRTAAFRDGALTIVTPSSAWSHQLTFLAPTIVARLSERCPGIALRKLRFVVATGRSRVLLAGSSQPLRRKPRGGSALSEHASAGSTAWAGAAAHPTTAPVPSAADRPEIWLARLRDEQTRLDRRRLAQGWRRCRSCDCWSPAPVCVPCAQAQQRAADGRVAQLIAAAPWLRFHEHVRHSPALDARAYARVRRSLLAQWERQVHAAQPRLRRDALDAADRVVAWSYVMLALHVRQEDVTPAVLAGTLGSQWADALLGGVAVRAARASERRIGRCARSERSNPKRELF